MSKLRLKYSIITLSIIILFSGCLPNENLKKSHQNIHDKHRCKELAERVESLKGKPIRRNAAYEQYKVECLNQSVLQNSSVQSLS